MSKDIKPSLSFRGNKFNVIIPAEIVANQNPQVFLNINTV